MNIEYKLKKLGHGWQCHVDGCDCCGWGSRPDLAIRSWTQQHTLNAKDAKQGRNERILESGYTAYAREEGHYDD